MKERRSSGIGCAAVIAIVLLLTGVFTGVAVGAAPVTTRIAAPLLCPSGTTESVIVVTPGGRNVRWYLYCLNADGIGSEPPTAAIVFTLAGAIGTVLGALGGLAYLGSRRPS